MALALALALSGAAALRTGPGREQHGNRLALIPTK
jgi:hypothetical protein